MLACAWLGSSWQAFCATAVARNDGTCNAQMVDRIGDPAALSGLDAPADSTIVYSTVGRSQYAFDIHTRDLSELGAAEFGSSSETRATDGISINTNGAFDRRAPRCPLSLSVPLCISISSTCLTLHACRPTLAGAFAESCLHASIMLQKLSPSLVLSQIAWQVLTSCKWLCRAGTQGSWCLCRSAMATWSCTGARCRRMGV